MKQQTITGTKCRIFHIYIIFYMMHSLKMPFLFHNYIQTVKETFCNPANTAVAITRAAGSGGLWGEHQPMLSLSWSH